jgi:hypothetical protein
VVSGCPAWRDLEWVQLLVDGRLLRSTRLTRSFNVLPYPSGTTVSGRALGLLADALRAHATSSRPAGANSPLAARPCWSWPTCARARPTPTWPAAWQIGTSTVYRYVRQALALRAARAPTLAQAIDVARDKALVILDGTTA